jgi:hypothetical protein
MADRKPLKVLPDGGGDSTGLAEFVDADTIGVVDGGTGLATVATSNILTGNGTSALSAETNLTFDGSALTVTGTADVSGDFTAGTVNADGDTAADDNAAMGYTDVEGLILTGQGSTNDVTIKNDADLPVIVNPTGLETVRMGRLTSNSATGEHVALVLKNKQSTVTTDASVSLRFETVESDAIGQGSKILVGRDANYGTVANLDDYMSFWTMQNNSETEKMRILSSGILLLGKTASNNGVAGVEITSSTGFTSVTVDNNTCMQLNRLSGTGTLASLRYAGTEKGSISTDGSNVAFNTSSDYRLKENVIDLTDATSRVAQLQPRRFNFKETPDVTKDGFIAHEASAVVPEAVTGTKDGTKTLSNVIVDAAGNVIAEDITEAQWTSGKEPKLVSEAVEAVDAVLYVDGDEIPEGKSVGDVKIPAVEAAEAVYSPVYAADTVWHETLTVPEYQGIDQAKLVPLLTAAIQELTARVAALESA